MKRTNQQSHQHKIDTFLGGLRDDYAAVLKSLALSAEAISRLGFEVDKSLGELRKIILATPHLNDADFEKVLSGVHEEWKKQLQNFQSEASAATSAENVACEKLRQDISRIEAEREAWNLRPEVVAGRRELEKVNGQITKLNGELAHARGIESKLVSLCQRQGIDPRLPSASGETER